MDFILKFIKNNIVSILSFIKDIIVPILTGINTFLLIKYSLNDGPKFKSKDMDQNIWSYINIESEVDNKIENKIIYIFLPCISIFNIGSQPSEVYNMTLEVDGLELELKEYPMIANNNNHGDINSIKFPIMFDRVKTTISPGSSKSGYILFAESVSKDLDIGEETKLIGNLKYEALSSKTKAYELNELVFSYMDYQSLSYIYKDLYLCVKDI